MQQLKAEVIGGCEGLIQLKLTCPLYVKTELLTNSSVSIQHNILNDLGFFVPESLRQRGVSNYLKSSGEMPQDISDAFKVEIEELNTLSLSVYEGLIAAGVSRQQAESVLPQTKLVELILTGNKKELETLSMNNTMSYETAIIINEIKKAIN